MNFKAIGFDYGGVIAGIPGPEFEKRAAAVIGVELDAFQDAYFEFNQLVNSNVITWEEFWRKVTAELGAPDKHKDIISFVESLPKHEINNQVLNLVDALKVHGYKTGLLSNNSIEAANHFRETGLINHFDAVIVSAEIGFSKPHPKAFEFFVDKLGVKPNELIFIDDTKKSLVSAEEIGFYPILFISYESLLVDLKSIGVKV